MTLKCGQRLGQKMFFWIFSLKKPVTVTSFCLIDGSEISSGDDEAEIGKSDFRLWCWCSLCLSENIARFEACNSLDTERERESF